MIFRPISRWSRLFPRLPNAGRLAGVLAELRGESNMPSSAVRFFPAGHFSLLLLILLLLPKAPSGVPCLAILRQMIWFDGGVPGCSPKSSNCRNSVNLNPFTKLHKAKSAEVADPRRI